MVGGIESFPPSIFTLFAIAGLFLRRLCDLPSFYASDFNITRDYTSNITRDYTSNITRDYTSTLWDITLQHYEILHFQHYERLIFYIMRDYTSNIMRDYTSNITRDYTSNITRDCFSISITRLPSIGTIGWYWRWMFLFSRRTLLPRPSLPSSLSPVYSYGAYASYPLFMRLISTLWEIDILHYERLHFQHYEMDIPHYERLL